MRIALFCLAMLAAGPATALSCLRPDAVRLFQQARDAEAAYYIVRGRVSLLEAPNLPERGSTTAAFTRSRIDGKALTASGFRAPFSGNVTIEVTCVGPWCGGLDGLDGELIMAIEANGDKLVLRIGPCGGDQVRWDKVGEERLLRCYRTGDCRPETP